MYAEDGERRGVLEEDRWVAQCKVTSSNLRLHRPKMTHSLFVDAADHFYFLGRDIAVEDSLFGDHVLLKGGGGCPRVEVGSHDLAEHPAWHGQSELPADLLALPLPFEGQHVQLLGELEPCVVVTQEVDA